MTILHVLDELNRGGAETLVLDLCRNAKKNGLNIILVSLRDGDLSEDFKKTGIDFIILSRKRPLDIKTVFKLRKILKEKNITVFHAHTSTAALHTYLASLGLKIKRILTHHGISPNTKRLRYKLQENFLVPRMNVNIAVSKAFLQRIEREKGFRINNFRVIYNGIDVSKFDDEREKEEKKEKIQMGMTANFVRTKDQLTVCKALPAVFSKFPDSKFIFIGARTEQDASYFEECRNYCIKNNIQEKVIFTGKKKNVPEILKSLDLFVFSSLNESFGIAVTEAMLSGVPAVVSDIPAMLEISDNGKYAKIFEKGNSYDLSQKIEEMLCNIESAKNIAIEAKAWAKAKFSIENHIKELLHLYKEIG